MTYGGLVGILEGMRWNLPAADIAPGLRLRSPSHNDLTVLAQHRERHPALRSLTENSCFIESEGAVELPPTIERAQDAIAETANHRLERPLLILRLFKEGPVGLRWAAMIPESGSKEPGQALPLGHLPVVRHHGAPQFYTIQSDELPNLVNWFSRDWPESLMNRPGVSWFMRSYTEAYDEHRALQLVFGLEHILLYKEKDRSNLRYKFALRGAWALGSDPEERTQLFQQMKTLYDLRSEIVHGKGASSLDEDEIRMIRTADGLLRRLLCLTLPTSKNPDWDQLILAGGNR